MGIGGMLSQEGHLVAYFSEKLNDVRQRYSTYNKEFYAIVQSLKQWSCLLDKEFILYSHHQALSFLNAQKKLIPGHAKWVEFLQMYTFAITRKVGKENVVANTLN